MKKNLLLALLVCMLCLVGCRGREKAEDTASAKPATRAVPVSTLPPDAVTVAPAAVPVETASVPLPVPEPVPATALEEPAVESKTDPVQTVTLDLGDGLNMDFVMMSTGQGNAGTEEGQPARAAGPSYMAQNPVTPDQWAKVMGGSPGDAAGTADPAVKVTWKECQAFLVQLKEKTDGMDVRVPTDVEWSLSAGSGGSEDAWVEVNSANPSRPGYWGPYDMKGMGLAEFVKASETMTKTILPVMAPPAPSSPAE